MKLSVILRIRKLPFGWKVIVVPMLRAIHGLEIKLFEHIEYIKRENFSKNFEENSLLVIKKWY